MQGCECSKGMSLRWDYGTLGQDRREVGMEWGGLGRVGEGWAYGVPRTESRVKVRMENREVMDTK